MSTCEPVPLLWGLILEKYCVGGRERDKGRERGEREGDKGILYTHFLINNGNLTRSLSSISLSYQKWFLLPNRSGGTSHQSSYFIYSAFFFTLFWLYLLLYHSPQLQGDFRISLNFKMRAHPDMSWLSYYWSSRWWGQISPVHFPRQHELTWNSLSSRIHVVIHSLMHALIQHPLSSIYYVQYTALNKS